MKSKTIITVVLLLFVVVSVIFLVAKEVQERYDSNTFQQQQVMALGTAGSIPATKPQELLSHSNQLSKKVIVYYFHGTARCRSCLRIEALTNQAIQDNFSDDIKAGRLQWQKVNVDEPGSKHFVKDYGLYTKSVVVVNMQGDKQLRWKNLEQIWHLLGDKDAFLQYVTAEIKSYLEED